MVCVATAATADGVAPSASQTLVCLRGARKPCTLLQGRVDMTGDVNMSGPLSITGPLEKPGGSFKIDHPLDPANKYLSHSFVESPDMKNVYDGVVILDDKGEAVIELPDWFSALNKDFRYQLTAIGAPAPNLHIAEEISDATTTINHRSIITTKTKTTVVSRLQGVFQV